MKYETPELTSLAPAVTAIQAFKMEPISVVESPQRLTEQQVGAYEGWE
jgi:hypothetical protein